MNTSFFLRILSIPALIVSASIVTSIVSSHAAADPATDLVMAAAARRRPTPVPTPIPQPPSTGIPAGQADLIAAQAAGRGVSYIEVKDVVVVENLQDDRRGLPHQKWTVRLANGNLVMGVYNIRGVPKIPLQPGDVISMGGEYIYDRGGGLLHWLHEDDHGRRPNGYVELRGVRYGALNPTGIYR